MCIPTVADCGPPRGSDPRRRMAFSRSTLCLMSIAGVAGLPQVTLPIAEIDGCPIGLSLIGSADSDALNPRLLAVKLMAGPEPPLRRVPDHALAPTPARPSVCDWFGSSLRTETVHRITDDKAFVRRSMCSARGDALRRAAATRLEVSPRPQPRPALIVRRMHSKGFFRYGIQQGSGILFLNMLSPAIVG